MRYGTGVGVVAIVMGGLTLLTACGGSTQETRQDPPQTTPVQTGPLVTAEQNDAIDALFRRKAPQLQTCWQEEYQRNGNRKVEGDVSVQMMVSRDGHARDLKIVKSTMGVDAIDQCVLKEVATWAFPEGAAEAPYRRTVHLGPAF